jgi:hypothetical protein
MCQKSKVLISAELSQPQSVIGMSQDRARHVHVELVGAHERGVRRSGNAQHVVDVRPLVEDLDEPFVVPA